MFEPSQARRTVVVSNACLIGGVQCVPFNSNWHGLACLVDARSGLIVNLVYHELRIVYCLCTAMCIACVLRIVCCGRVLELCVDGMVLTCIV